MRLANVARGLVFAPALLLLAACSSGDTHCTCGVANNGERGTIACGESACIGGTTVSCTDKNESVLRGACTAPAASLSADSGTPTQISNPEPNRSCDDLLSFCTTECGSPASVSADCQATANSGDAAACAEWSLSNGVLCHP